MIRILTYKYVLYMYICRNIYIYIEIDYLIL